MKLHSIKLASFCVSLAFAISALTGCVAPADSTETDPEVVRTRKATTTGTLEMEVTAVANAVVDRNEACDLIFDGCHVAAINAQAAANQADPSPEGVARQLAIYKQAVQACRQAWKKCVGLAEASVPNSN